jgi:hypothetical protein
MVDLVQKLIARAGIDCAAPASAIEAVCAAFGADLPASLLELWQIADGVEFTQFDAHLVGPSEVLKTVAGSDWLSFGWLPLLNDHQSNYLILYCHEPLRFRVGYLPHDGDRRLLYRTLDAFLLDLLRALDQDESADSFFRETAGEYGQDSPRSPEDHQAARDLLKTPNENGEWNDAVQLLDESNIEEWTKLLETDHFVRRDVRARMKSRSSPAIRDLLKHDAAAFRQFTDDLVAAVRQAGLDVGQQREGTVQIGGKWYDADFFFHRRRIPDAMPRLVMWIQDQLARRNPYDRAGNYMSD